MQIPLFCPSSLTVPKLSEKPQFLRKPTKNSNYLQYKTLWKEFLTLTILNQNNFQLCFADFNFYISSLTVPEMLHFLRLFYRSSTSQQPWTLLNTFQFPTDKPSNRKNFNFNTLLIFNFLIKSRNAENFGNVPPPHVHKEIVLFSNNELSDLKLGRLNWKRVKVWMCRFHFFVYRVSQWRNCAENHSSSENPQKLQITCNMKHYEMSSSNWLFGITMNFCFSLLISIFTFQVSQCRKCYTF